MISRRTFIASLPALGLAACAGHTIPGETMPTSTRRSLRPQGLTQLHDQLSTHVTRGGVPGLVAAVACADDLHVEVLGKLALDDARPMQRDALFRIASMTKPVIAAATLLLIDEGKLALDEPVDRLLPELARRQVLRTLESPLDDTVAATRAITVRDLLTFRMGFGQLMAAPDAYPILRRATDLEIGMGPPSPGHMPAPDEWLRRLGSLPLMCQPGERWLYNTGSDVLAVLIARASGMELEAYLRARLFAPLGMEDTSFSVPTEKRARLATSYWTNPASGQREVYDPPNGQWSTPPAFPSGAGGLVSTLDDYLAFARMILNGGRHRETRILSEAAVRAMRTDQLTPAQKAASQASLVPGFFDDHGWGLGVTVVTRGNASEALDSFGWDGGLGTSWRVAPRENLTGILLTQSGWESPQPPAVMVDFWRATYAALG